MAKKESKTKKAAYEQYKAMKKKEQQEKEREAKKSLNYNPLAGGPLSKDPLADVKKKR